MKVRVIYCERQDDIKKTNLKIIRSYLGEGSAQMQLIGGQGIYERIGRHLVQLCKVESPEELMHILRKKDNVKGILLMPHGSAAYIKCLNESLLSTYQYTIFMGEVCEEIKHINKSVIYMPQLKEINFEVNVLLNRLLDEESQSNLRGTLLLGKATTLGEMAEQILKQFNYVYDCNYLRLDLYSKNEIGLEVMSQIEDAILAYTEGKLEVDWKPLVIEDKQDVVYFSLEANK